MARIEARLEEMGLTLPEPMRLPPGMELPFAWVRVRGGRAYVSGHGPLHPDGSSCGPFGKVGHEVTPEEGYEAGTHARTAPGVATLPLNHAVFVSAELEITGYSSLQNG